jgi:UDP-N-acetylmuramate--alanine ligase
VFVPSINDMASNIIQFAKAGDVVLCMGAGSMGGVCGQVLTILETQS